MKLRLEGPFFAAEVEDVPRPELLREAFEDAAVYRSEVEVECSTSDSVAFLVGTGEWSREEAMRLTHDERLNRIIVILSNDLNDSETMALTCF